MALRSTTELLKKFGNAWFPVLNCVEFEAARSVLANNHRKK